MFVTGIYISNISSKGGGEVSKRGGVCDKANHVLLITFLIQEKIFKNLCLKIHEFLYASPDD